MALTGHLSDLSLSELIEFFCNQRKSGRLKVLYPKGAGYFYLQAGSVIDARIGALHGIDAVFFALTLPNAEFEFSADVEAKSRTINQPWTQVVLEGLRRLDENIPPGVAFPPDYVPEPDELEGLGEHRVGLVQLRSHARPLSALAGEHERDLARCHLPVDHAGGGLGVGKGVQTGQQLIAVGTDHRGPIPQPGPAGGQREPHIGQIELRTRHQMRPQPSGLIGKGRRAFRRHHSRGAERRRPSDRSPSSWDARVFARRCR